MNQSVCTARDEMAHLPDEKDLALECSDTANLLIDVLERESGILRRFAQNELVDVLSRKEGLIHELDQRLKDLLKTNPRQGDAASNAALRVLRERLRKIDALNRKNAMFIQGALSFFRDLLGVFTAPGYGPVSETASQGLPRVPTGLTIRMEA